MNYLTMYDRTLEITYRRFDGGQSFQLLQQLLALELTDKGEVLVHMHQRKVLFWSCSFLTIITYKHQL